MKLRLFFLLLLAAAMIAGYNFILHPQNTAVTQPIPAAAAVPAGHRILLVPLDTRPPCRQFVQNAGLIADTEILSPPHEILDYYSQPGDTHAVMEWLDTHMDDAEAVILSVDQLLYGGLLTAREADRSPEELDAFIQALTALAQRHPHTPIYAFSILPRISPPDSIDGYQERKLLMKYSRRLDALTQAGEADNSAELADLREKIPAASLQKYLALFAKNAHLNEKLSLLAKDGILTRLIIGQDDGEVLGIPNMEKQRLRSFLAQEGISETQVCITHGADEIALTLLAELRAKALGSCHPRIYLAYNDPATPELVMPYMASSTEETAREKIQMLQGEIVTDPADADFILYLSCGTKDSLSGRQANVRQIQDWLAEGRRIALVDLSEHFQAQEVLLPFLLRADVPLQSLLAYAGWNTASNSIGTALAQSILCEAQLRQSQNQADALRTVQANLTFLNNRCLEDYYYLKDVIELVDTSLRKAGYTNVNDLDLEHNYRWTNVMLREAMQQRIRTYKHTRSFRAPVTIDTPVGPLHIQARDLTADMSYPWPRTFEIYLHSALYLVECSRNS